VGQKSVSIWHGIIPLHKKANAIKNIATPKTRKELRQFIGMVK
jgi:hypothetical protein